MPDLLSKSQDGSWFDKIGTTINDVGTNLLTLPSKFRFANEEELKAGRGSWKDRLPLLTETSTQLIGNELVGGAMSKLMPKNSSQFIQTFFPETAASRRTVEPSMSFAEKRKLVQPAMDAKEEGIQWLKDWTSSDSFRRRAKNMEFPWSDKTLQKAKSYNDRFGVKDSYKNWVPDNEKMYNLKNLNRGYLAGTTPENINTASEIKFNKLPSWINGASDSNGFYLVRRDRPPENITSTTIHEATHNITDNGFNKKGSELIAKVFGDYNSTIPSTAQTAESVQNYYRKPTEIYARVMQLRHHFGLKPGELVSHSKSNEILRKVTAEQTPVSSELIPDGPHFNFEGWNALFNKLPVVGVAAGVNSIEKKQIGGKINWLQKGYKLPSKVERARRQMVIESNLDSLATSPKGAYGWFQMLPGTHNDYVKETGDKASFEHLSNFDQAFKERNWYMDKLNSLDFLKNKPGSPLVKAAKTYAAYNAGPGPIVDALNNAKANGEDIYNSLNWLNDIPEESRNYVNKMFGKDPIFEQKYKESKSNPNASFLKKIKFQIGGRISQEEIDKANAKKTYINKPGARMTQDLKDAYTQTDNRSNFFSDMGTNLLVMPTQFWPASQEQLALGRGSWRDRLQLGVKSAEMGLVNQMIPGFINKISGAGVDAGIAKTFAGYSSKKLNRAGQFLDEGVEGYKFAKGKLQDISNKAKPITSEMAPEELKNMRDISRLTSISKKENMNPIDLYNLYLKSTLTDDQLQKMVGMSREDLKNAITNTSKTNSYLTSASQPETALDRLSRLQRSSYWRDNNQLPPPPDEIILSGEVPEVSIGTERQLRGIANAILRGRPGSFNIENALDRARRISDNPNLSMEELLGRQERYQQSINTSNSGREAITQAVRDLMSNATVDNPMSMTDIARRRTGELQETLNVLDAGGSEADILLNRLRENFGATTLTREEAQGLINFELRDQNQFINNFNAPRNYSHSIWEFENHPDYDPFNSGHDPIYAQQLTARNNKRQLEGANTIGQRIGLKLNPPKLDKKLIPFKIIEDNIDSKLPSLMDPNGAMEKMAAAADIKSINKGYYQASTSLSDNSLPLYLTKLQNIAKTPRMRPLFTGYDMLNPLGNVSNAGVAPEKISELLNTQLKNLNIGGFKIPKTYVEDGQVYYPSIVMQKYQKGNKLSLIPKTK